MNPPKIRCLLPFLASAIVAHGLSAQAPQVEFPQPSPAAALKQRVGLTDIEIAYSRPGVKGREIFGGLEAYGKVWRTGANNATTITFSTPVTFGGAEVPAGTYGLFSIPGEKEWTVILNKNAGQWGAYRYKQEDDLARVKATPVRLAEPVETFTIGINDIRDESATLEIVWEKTRVPVKIEVDLVGKLTPQIEATMAAPGDKKPYFQAAMFYLEHNIDLQKAKTWVDAAVAEREAHYIVFGKARILAGLGDKTGAIAAATRAKELAIKANDGSYVKQSDDLIASLR